jgi:hypothetical protein
MEPSRSGCQLPDTNNSFIVKVWMSILHVQAVRANDTPVPQAGIRYRALLIAEVHIGRQAAAALQAEFRGNRGSQAVRCRQ